MPSLRIALAQLNLTVGDIAGNRRLIEQAIRRAQAWLAELVVVPELALTGYPPEDLLLKPQFVQANRTALESLVGSSRGIVAVVGYVDRDREGRLYNAAALLADGRHVATYHKQCLPNYGVFDEKRYFTPGTQPLVLTLGGIRIGLTICEDLWEERPAQVLSRAGCQLLVNLSASPYHAGKLKTREQLFGQRARSNGLAIAYCNLVGGQDELVFDGGSLVLDVHGRELIRGRQFREDVLLVDLSSAHLRRSTSRAVTTSIRRAHAPRERPALPRVPFQLDKPNGTFERNPIGRRFTARLSSAQIVGTARGSMRARVAALGPVEEVYEALTLGLRDYVRKNGFSTVVLGLSGGIDSALTACIATDALGPTHVIGVVMPSRFSSGETQEDAKRLAHELGIEVREISIEPIFQSYLETLTSLFVGRTADVTEQNIQARIRWNLLMALSNKFGWLVLTTGNKSETATGYTTLYGDMAGGFAVIKDVPKMLVYELATFRNRRGSGSLIPPRIFKRAPTAELAPNQRDQDTLPPYEVLDRILKAYVEEDRSLRELLATNRVAPETVRRVIQMVDHAEYKRRQGPPGIKITPRAFGKDRRMPVTNRYHQT